MVVSDRPHTHTGRFTPRKKAPVLIEFGAEGDPQIFWKVLEKRKSLTNTGIRTPGCPTLS